MTAPFIPDQDEFERWKAGRATARPQTAAPVVPDEEEFEAWKASSRPLTAKGRARGLLQSAYQDLTFGLGNKLTAATRAVLPQWLGGTEGFDYSGALQEERGSLDRFRSEHPYAAAASGAVGAIPSMIATAGTSPMVNQALKLTQQAAPLTFGQSVKAGAKFGAMYGAGEPDNPDPLELAQSTAIGAGVGGTAAGVIHGAARAPRAVMDHYGMRPSEKSPSRLAGFLRRIGVETTEDRIPAFILERLERGEITPADVSASFARASASGKPATLIEAGGQPMTRLARGTQQVRSKGADDVRNMLETRRAESPVRVGADVESGLRQPRQDVFEQQGKLVEQQITKAKPHYKRAMESAPVSLDAATSLEDGTSLSLRELLKRPSMQKAIGYGKQLAQETGEAFPDLSAAESKLSEVTKGMTPEAREKFAAAAASQGVELTPTVKFEHLHNLKLRLDEMLGYAKAKGQLPDGTPATSKMLRAIQDTKKRLLDIMDAHSPDYAQGRRVWGGEAELQDGLALGADFVKPGKPIGELKHDFGQLSDAAKEQARVGVVAAVREQIDRAVDGADVVRRIFGNEAQRKRLRLAFPDEQSFQSFRAQMEIESQMAKNENVILGNSQTAEKLADAADFMDGVSPAMLTSPSAARNAILDRISRVQLRKMTEARADALAPYLTAGGPGGTMPREEVLRRIMEAANRRRPGSQLSRVAGAAIGGQTGRRTSGQ